MDYLLYIAVGAFAGFISGLFGLGGGIIIVPALILTFTANEFPVEVVTHLAIGTSLATIVVTSITSTLTHHQKNAVRWDLAAWLVPGILIGAVFGGLLAVRLSGNTLQLLFGCLMIFVAIQLLKASADTRMSQLITPCLAAGGIFIGAISALFGIGGGTLTTPLLTRFGIKIRQAVGTSAACGLPIAIAGGSTYLIFGLGNEALPKGSLGYIFIPAWLGMILTSMPFARLGALIAHRVNEQLLKQLFAGTIFVFGVRFIWLNAQATIG